MSNYMIIQCFSGLSMSAVVLLGAVSSHEILNSSAPINATDDCLYRRSCSIRIKTVGCQA